MRKFACAFTGLVDSIKHKSVMIQFLLGIIAIVVAILFQFTFHENMLVLLCICAVIAAEIFNTCIEKLCDLYTTETNEQIKCIKDMAAGAVLFVSIMAAIIGLCIFIQHI